MKKIISSRSVLGVGKLCLLIIALAILCAVAPSYAALIESNGTGKYEITGNDTWGLMGPPTDENISSLVVEKDATLNLVWETSATSIKLGTICGDGELAVSGGGTINGQYLSSGVAASQSQFSVYGVSSVDDINLKAENVWGIFTFYKLALDNDAHVDDVEHVSMPGGAMSVKNVRLAADANASAMYGYSHTIGQNVNVHKTVEINGDTSISLESSDVLGVSWGELALASMTHNGDSIVSLNKVGTVDTAYSDTDDAITETLMV